MPITTIQLALVSAGRQGFAQAKDGKYVSGSWSAITKSPIEPVRRVVGVENEGLARESELRFHVSHAMPNGSDWQRLFVLSVPTTHLIRRA